MTEQRIDALEVLLVETEDAHGVYETEQLNGVYDEEWPRWYATYAVAHGIGRLVGRDIDVEELTAFLATSWQDTQGEGGGSAETWAADTARRIAARL